MKSLKICFAGLIVLALLGACGSRAGQPANTQGPTISETPVGESATSTLLPSVTPVPAPTLHPTSNLVPTVTPFPTISFLPAATFTPRTPFWTMLPYKTIYWSPTVAGYNCTSKTIYPAFGQVFGPRTDFVAKFQAINTGKSPWTIGDVALSWVSGTRMTDRDHVDSVVVSTVYVYDKYNFQVHMVPPKDPGWYTTVWGLHKTDKDKFFCTFDVNIQVK